MKMNKKALSILLAASMVFSMNISSFAAETTATEVTTIETQSQYKSQTDNGYKDRYKKTSDSIVSNNKTQTENALKSGITFGGLGGLEYGVDLPAAGKKMTVAKLKEELGFVTVSVDGYRTIATNYKITSNAKTPGSVISFKVKELGGYKYVMKWDAKKGWLPLTAKEAKAGYKIIKAKKSAIKSAVFQTYVKPKTFKGVVSADYIKAIGKKAVSRNAVEEAKLNGSNVDIRDYVVVTKKNGKIKKVQYVSLESVAETYSYFTNLKDDYSNGDDSEDNSTSKGDSDTRLRKRGLIKRDVNLAGHVKIKLKNLKKNKDYTIENNKVVLNGSRNYYDGVGSDQDFTANW